ncbi:MAG: hypothetical protein K2W82_03240 [Candidatus Obscuribacterales bacterium]|nr:hypothetical protein [Candidatus Obscuribacterales bacterium]
MAQQKGFKRAQKVLKRKQKLAKDTYRSNLKKAVYALEKAANESEHDHDHEDHKDHAHG